MSAAAAGCASAPAGLIIAAPASGSGKTVVTLGLLRHWARSGLRVASAKVGPDYIDPAFHAAASGRPCFNLDLWATRPATVRAVAARLAEQAEIVVCEGVMGLFDGAVADCGSTADVAVLSGWPLLLVVDARAQAASAAAVVRGFATHRAGLGVAAVVFNRVGGERHAAAPQEKSSKASFRSRCTSPGVSLVRIFCRHSFSDTGGAPLCSAAKSNDQPRCLRAWREPMRTP